MGITDRAFSLTLKALNKTSSRRACPLCDWTGFQFLPNKQGPLFRFEALCPQCGSAERHRLVYVLLEREMRRHYDSVLHFAPEPLIEKWLRQKTDRYISADLSDRAMHQVDIQNLPYEDKSFSLIWCSHVLEHIPDDRLAMRELRRVLTDDGIAVVQVPLWGKVTVEDDLTVPERVRHYYQADHLRRYGRDITDRFEAEGLSLRSIGVQDLDLQQVLRGSLNDMVSNDVFIVRRSASAQGRRPVMTTAVAD